MKVVAMIPIKLNNERTPGKNTMKFDDGTPLLRCLMETLTRIRLIDEIYLFCSDESVKEYLIPGVKYLKRPKNLDTAQATPQDIIREFMLRVDADIYIASHVTSPFVTANHITECIEAVLSGEHDSSFTAEKVQRLAWGEDGKPLNFDAENIPRTQDLTPFYFENSAAYVFKKEVFLNYNRRIGNTPHMTIVDGVECVDIDYPADFKIANAVYMHGLPEVKNWIE